MDSTIKSAYERALERAEKIEISGDKLQQLEYKPKGAVLAANFLKEEKFDLAKALAEFNGEPQTYVLEGVQATFLSNIILPRNPRNKRDSQRAMEGLKVIKRNKSKLTQLLDKIDSLMAYYERTKQQAYDNLKKEFEGALRQAAQQQQLDMRQQNPRADAELQAEFQMKWRELSARVDTDYENNLNGLKKEIERVS